MLTYNIQQGGVWGCSCRVLGVCPSGYKNRLDAPLPSAAGHGMVQREPSVLHISVVAVEVSNSSELAECTLSTSTMDGLWPILARWSALEFPGMSMCDGVWSYFTSSPRISVIDKMGS